MSRLLSEEWRRSDTSISDELFYQLALLQFGSLGTIELDPPPPVASLLRIAVDAETGLEEAGLDPERIFKVSDQDSGDFRWTVTDVRIALRRFWNDSSIGVRC